MIKTAGILIAYVMASNREKIWVVLGQEFWDDAGKYAVIVRALYSQKNACALFRAHLAKSMQELGY